MHVRSVVYAVLDLMTLKDHSVGQEWYNTKNTSPLLGSMDAGCQRSTQRRATGANKNPASITHPKIPVACCLPSLASAAADFHWLTQSAYSLPRFSRKLALDVKVHPKVKFAILPHILSSAVCRAPRASASTSLFNPLIPKPQTIKTRNRVHREDLFA